ncbi:acetyltransferase [Serratia microhaemolytica]|uniref:acetyltransferase n=1 Tax=Serratia microhaemolytica TaxID=2675110 RepID=UPI000FDDCADE|nr:acetyltransferase [Serratia microhaemolytica]
MITLTYPTPQMAGEESLDHHLFTLPPQGEPLVSASTQAHLQRLHWHIDQRLTRVVGLTCHPHRVGLSSCVAVTMKGKLHGIVNILITVSNGQENWPTEEDYSHPRWYITVTDTADMLYLVLWLGRVGEGRS